MWLELRPLVDFVSAQKEKGVSSLCTVMATKVDPSEALLYGQIIKHEATNELQHYVEKPKSFVSNLINCGIYYFQN